VGEGEELPVTAEAIESVCRRDACQERNAVQSWQVVGMRPTQLAGRVVAQTFSFTYFRSNSDRNYREWHTVPDTKRMTLSGEKWVEEIATSGTLQTSRNGLLTATRGRYAAPPEPQGQVKNSPPPGEGEELFTLCILLYIHSCRQEHLPR
jgi:hypothetical protein